LELLLNPERNTAKDDPRRVVIKELRIIYESRPKGDVIFTLDTQADVEAMKNKVFFISFFF